jgi:hypothetical protein
MSLIPPVTASAAQIASSAAGAQRPDALGDRTAEAGAVQRLAADRDELAARSLGDVGQMDGSADRDADGRRQDEPTEPALDPQEDETEDVAAADSPPARPADPTGERGSHLDLDA